MYTTVTIRNQNAILIRLALEAYFFFSSTIYICDFLSFSSYSLYMELAPSKLSDVLETPALMVVMRSMEACSKLRVYCRCELAVFIDWMARPGSLWANSDFFWA